MTETPGINGRYDVGELLGRGGMAEVRQATDNRLGRSVAIKRLRTDLAGDPTFQARFRREAQSAASLNHPAIVSVYDTGEEITVGEDGMSVAQPYIVMEYVAGRTLREVLNDGRKLLPERALEIASGVLSALDYSHRMGIIHRDIKPANVMLTPNGEVKVMDFGIARAMADQQNTMTQTSAVVGTAQYLSPEQARGENVDNRSDIYSTGCLLFELLTGRPPFVGDSPVAVAYQHVREQAPRPSTVEPGVPTAIDTIVMKALAKNVDERYQTAAAMKADIDRYLAGQPIHASAPATAVVPMGGAANDHPTQVGGIAAYEEEPRSKGPLIALAVALLVVIAAAAFAIPKVLSNDTAGAKVQVPSDLVGKTVAQAQEKLKALKLVPEIQPCQQPSNATTTNKCDQVIASVKPAAGSWVEENSTVQLFLVSHGFVTIPPNLADMKHLLPDVTNTLTGLGLQVTPKPADSDKPKDTVLAVAPESGKQVPINTAVTVTYASGNNKIPAFDASTKSNTYTTTLNSLGFAQVKATESTDPSPMSQGTVLSVLVNGTPVTPGSPQDITQVVTIIYANGQNYVPDVSSNCQTLKAAQDALKAEGFAEAHTTDTSGSNPKHCAAGTVLSQLQPADSIGQVGSTVNLTIVPSGGGSPSGSPTP